MFRMILNLIDPTEGEIRFNGEKIDQNILDKFGYLPEEGSLLPNFSVIDICEYYGALKKMPKNQVHESLAKWLKEFHMEEYMKQNHIPKEKACLYILGRICIYSECGFIPYDIQEELYKISEFACRHMG